MFLVFRRQQRLYPSLKVSWWSGSITFPTKLEDSVRLDLWHALDIFNQGIVPVHIMLFFLLILVAMCEDDSDWVRINFIDNLSEYLDVIDVISLRPFCASEHQ